MTDRTCPDLDPHDGLAGTELCAIHQDGRLVRLTLAELAQWIRTAESIVPASEPFEGVLLERTSVLAGVSFPLIAPWQAAAYDTMGFWSGGAPTRITIPPGVSKGRLIGAGAFTAIAQAGSIYCSIYQNGATMKFNLGHNIREGTVGYTNNGAWSWTPVIAVAPGDFFELRFNKSGMISVTELLHDTSSFFAFEVVEKSP